MTKEEKEKWDKFKLFIERQKKIFKKYKNKEVRTTVKGKK